MAIPDYQSLMLPVLLQLAQRRSSTVALIPVIADAHGLTQAERSELLPSGRQTTFANRVHWALAYLNKAGLITRVSRGEYEASREGHVLVGDPPERITVAYLQRYPAFQE